MEPQRCSRGDLKAVADPCGWMILQWSHGVAAVETTPLYASAARVTVFQWSHGVAAVETIHSSSRSPAMGASLQWSHGVAAVET